MLLIVLSVLSLAWFFRWDYTASKTREWGVLKWKTDRWTGQKWVDIYRPRTSESKILSSPYIPINNKTATGIWADFAI